jgi:transcriptional pleiotropic regulator of transition state genes
MIMKSTGIVRRVDELGRIVLPKELRKVLNIEYQDSLEIFTEGETIVLRKYEPADIFTGETEDLIEYEGKKVSKQSILKMAQLAGFTVNESIEK